jgi:leucyl aminopeptidase
MATAASTTPAAVLASRLLLRRSPRLLRRLSVSRAPPAALASSSGRPLPPLARHSLGHRARMGHTAAAAAEPALGLTKPNAIEPPQVRVIARAFLPLVPV